MTGKSKRAFVSLSAVVHYVLDLWRLCVLPYLRVAFGGDKRSAALFRVALALTVLGDVVDRAYDLSAHYTDAGVLPRRLALEKFSNATWLSLHMWGGGWWAAALMFAFHLVAALVMLVGWHSRKATFVVWLMTTSLHSRNILVLHSGDVLLRCSLFWALFLPLGSVFSLDSAFKDRRDKPASSSKKPTASSSTIGNIFSSLIDSTSLEREKKEANDDRTSPTVLAPPSPGDRYAFINVGSLAVLLQVGLMYFTSVYHKSGDEWSVSGVATYYALKLDYFRTPVADLMVAALHPTLLPYFTFAVYYWEWLASFLMVFPFWTGPLRCLAVCGFMFMHVGFGSCMRLGTFFWAAEAALCPLLPAFFWDALVFRYLLRQTPERTQFELFYRRRSLGRFYERFAKVVTTFFLLTEAEAKPIDQLLLEDDSDDDEAPSRGQQPRSFADLDDDAVLVAVDHQGRIHRDLQALLALCRASPVLWPVGRLLARLAGLDQPASAPGLGSSPLVASGRPARRRRGLFVRAGAWLSVLVEAGLGFVLGRRLARMRARIRQQRAADKASAPFTRTIPLGRAASTRSGGLLRRLCTLNNVAALMRNLFCLWVVYFVFGWNMNNIGISQWVPRQGVRWVGYALHVDQAWNMFSPRPPDSSWWYIIEGSQLGETTVEMHRERGMFEWKGVPLDDDWGPPSSLSDTIGNHRWFKFYEQVNSNAEKEAIRLHWGRYICREWNKRHDYYERVYEFKIWQMSHRVDLEGTYTRLPKELLWHHVCYSTKPDAPNT